MSILLYLIYPMLYTMSFSALRQHLSIAFVMIALLHVDNYKKSIPLVLIAILCHTSSIVVLPFFFMRRFDLYKYNPIKLIGFLACGVLVSRYILNTFVSQMPRYGDVMLGETENNIVPAILLGSLIFAMSITGCLKRIYDTHDKYIINFLFYGFAISLFSIGQPGCGRLTLAFIYVLPVGISYLYKYTNKKGLASLYTLLVFILIFFFYSFIDVDIYKYSFFWESSINNF